ncbi:hypothetical protein ENBRE01_1143 [Enteropsectra breve]|nr:hypothetical protein ENBRE01_1143 [Enteropsectra breve]
MKSIYYDLKWNDKLNASDAVNLLRKIKHLPEVMLCARCDSEMAMHRDSSRSDSYRWVCKNCRMRKPIRQNTWTARFRVPLVTLLLTVRLYVEGHSAERAAQRLGVDAMMCYRIYSELNSYQKYYEYKFIELLTQSIDPPTCSMLMKTHGENFRTLGLLFPLHIVFKVVLDSLNEIFMKDFLENGQNK